MSQIAGNPLQADVDLSPAGYPAKFAVAGDFDGDGRDELAAAPEIGGTVGNDLWVMDYDPETKQLLISGVGQLHIEVTLERMKRKFNAEVVLLPPRIPYKETVKGRAQVQGRHKKQTGGRGQFGDCWIEIEPLPRGSGLEFVDKIFGGAIPRNFIPSVENSQTSPPLSTIKVFALGSTSVTVPVH